MKRLLKKLSAGLMIAALTVGMAFSSFAEVSGSDCDLKKVLVKIDEYANDTAYSETYNSAFLTWQGIQPTEGASEVSITFNGVTKYFNSASVNGSGVTETDVQYNIAYSIMNGELLQFSNVNTDTKTVEGAKNEVAKVVDILDAEAAVTEASEGMKSVMPLVNRFTGMIVVVVLLGMAIFTAFDVAYLVFPVAKSAMDNAGSSGNRATSSTNGKTGESKFRWITDDAINAYKEATETQKNPLMCYLMKRMWSYIAVAIVIYMLMSGNLGVIINFVLQMLESVFEMLGELSKTA